MVINELDLKNFKFKKDQINTKKKIKKNLINLLSSKSQIILSLSDRYKDSYTKKLIKKLKKYQTINLIGMGGSILGTKAIYNFVKSKINFNFIDEYHVFINKKKKNKKLNLIISKSGNTLETITNSNIISKTDKNILITENKKNYLKKFADDIRAEVIHHNNFIGGRYSVLSEVGMLPAELMGLNPKKFRNLNNLISNKNFLKLVIENVSMMFSHVKKKMNSVILNYDTSSKDFFLWYQQLVAESLGKRGLGVLPIVSSMPKDNHSLMQYYLDGPKNYFFTFFFVEEKNSKKIVNTKILESHKYLKNKNFNDICHAQFIATQKIFKKKKLPFRSFYIKQRNETVLGELFTFFILETILLGKMMKINPYNQPAVELIKNETKNILIDN